MRTGTVEGLTNNFLQPAAGLPMMEGAWDWAQKPPLSISPVYWNTAPLVSKMAGEGQVSSLFKGLSSCACDWFLVSLSMDWESLVEMKAFCLGYFPQAKAGPDMFFPAKRSFFPLPREPSAMADYPGF